VAQLCEKAGLYMRALQHYRCVCLCVCVCVCVCVSVCPCAYVRAACVHCVCVYAHEWL